MPKFEVMARYIQVESGQCWMTVEANTEEEAIEKAHEVGSNWDGFNARIDTFEIDHDYTEAFKLEGN